MSSVLIEHDGPILRLTLNRPDVRNAFDEDVIQRLSTAASRASEDSSLRAVVLAGTGKAFCAGADIAWMAKAVAYSRQENLSDAEDLARLLERLDTLPVPVIGRIQGPALGGGVGLAAICDIVVAADDAVFGFTEVRLGLIPAVISPFVIAKIGRSAARELFLTGDRFSAARAREIGLAHSVVPAADLDAEVARYQAMVVAGAPGAQSAAKHLIAEVSRRAPADAMSLCAEAIASRRVSPEGQEGIRAFLEKRDPSWPTGR